MTMTMNRPVLLASGSPRRKLLMEQAGYDVLVSVPPIDDGLLRQPAVSPRWWVMALAYLKARATAATGLALTGDDAAAPLILAADTLCVVDGKTLGQPRHADQARRMLESMRNREHITMTGVCLLDARDNRRFLAFDQATVRLGPVTDAQIRQYVESGQWRGKAGAYNLAERLDAGWPIQCIGDPGTVMGLPMQALPGWIESFDAPH